MMVYNQLKSYAWKSFCLFNLSAFTFFAVDPVVYYYQIETHKTKWIELLSLATMEDDRKELSKPEIEKLQHILNLEKFPDDADGLTRLVMSRSIPNERLDNAIQYYQSKQK